MADAPGTTRHGPQTECDFTRGQRRALLWLPADGGWASNVGDGAQGKGSCLGALHRMGLAECRRAPRGKHYGNAYAMEWRATPAGLAGRWIAELERDLEEAQAHG